MIYNCTRTATVRAGSDEVECVSLSRSALTKALGEALPRVIYVNTLRIALERSEIYDMINKD